MLAGSVRRLLSLCGLLALAACPAPSGSDAGADDAGALLSCAIPPDCLSLDAVCRQNECRTDAPCGDDLECGLGERCIGGRCRFKGCLHDADCASGKCLVDTYACAECGQNADCPTARPLCDVASHQCTGCLVDTDCQPPGPAYCGPNGACVHCLKDEQCPNGLVCGATSHLCEGVPTGSACPQGTACAQGNACVTVGTDTLCLPVCNLYAPNCATGQVCYKLTYSGVTSLVFETTGPIGVCYQQQAGLKNLREQCTRSAAGTNCQPNLQCVPETASVSLCRAFCDPAAPSSCQTAEKCTSFPGDYTGRRYGLCLPDNGWGLSCDVDGECKAGLSCQAYDDPSSYTELSPVCQFNQGTGTALAPCGPRTLPDGGTLSADRACQSGACRNDPLFPSGAPYFCLGTCTADTDCSYAGTPGSCDGTFSVTTAFGVSGYLKGCRPGCLAQSDCAAYDAGVACRVRVTGGSKPSLKGSCSPSAGTVHAGEPCSSNSQCQSGWCLLEDSRGVARTGTCAELCHGATGCSASPGAVPPLDCLETAVIGSRGSDFLANTADDLFLSPKACQGAACTSDDDCRPDGGVALCTPQVDGQDAGPGHLVLRCRTRSTLGSLPGGASCTVDQECQSGACGTLQAPSTGTGRACFQACTGATTCAGSTQCRAGGLSIQVAGAAISVDSCAP